MKHVTLEDLEDELAKGRVTEAELRDPTHHLDGFCDYSSRRVYVDPRPGVVEALRHELIHRRFPKWGERRVDAEAKRILGRMTDTTLTHWYRTYQETKRTRKRPKAVTE